MNTKIRNFFIIPYFAFGLLLIVFFILSLYYRHFVSSGLETIGNVAEHQSIDPKTVSVKIYNATEVNGLAKELKLYLKTFQVENISVENFGEFKQESIISSKPEILTYTKYIATLIEYNLDSIQISDTLDNDILIIIGRNYKILKPFKN